MSDLRSEAASFSARIKAELNHLPDLDGWDRLAARLQSPAARRAWWRLPAGGTVTQRVSPRTFRIGLAVCVMVALLGTSTALAARSGLVGGWLEKMGLATSGVSQVQASATDAGITVTATESYRDSYLVAIAIRVDDPGTHSSTVAESPSNESIMVTSSGQALDLVNGAKGTDGHRVTGQMWVFAAGDGSQVTGSDLTLTIKTLLRLPASPGVVISTADKGEIPGHWVLHFHLPSVPASTTPLTNPPADMLGDVQVTFHDFAVSGQYLAGHFDLSELVPGAIGREGEKQDIFLFAYGPDGRQLDAIAITGGTPGKGGPPEKTSASEYKMSYLFAKRGSGTHKLVVASGKHSVVRELQVP